MRVVVEGAEGADEERWRCVREEVRGGGGGGPSVLPRLPAEAS